MRKLINICGTSRSGSTMVDLMIGNDPQAFSLGEVHAWFRPFRTHHFNIICSCGQINCPWKKLKLLNENEFYEKCFELLNVNILVDSSKNLPWVIDNNIKALKKGIKVYNVLLYKQPVNFFYSFWKRNVPLKHARKKEFVKYYKRFFQTGLPLISMDYNKLVENPEKTLKSLCKLLEIPYFPQKEYFWTKKHHQLFGSIGTRKQVEASNSKIRKKEDYPKDFENIIPKIKMDVTKDIAFQDLLLNLKIHELKSQDFISNNKIHKPVWYYIMKIKQNIRQRFPEKWKYIQ
jgi:hypothetical protein